METTKLKRQHTPEPWLVKEWKTAFGADVSRIETENDAIAEIYGLYTSGDYDEKNAKRNAEKIANARLIAKAPSMLATLDILQAWLENPHSPEFNDFDPLSLVNSTLEGIQ